MRPIPVKMRYNSNEECSSACSAVSYDQNLALKFENAA
jgi:hypothetical protein